MSRKHINTYLTLFLKTLNLLCCLLFFSLNTFANDLPDLEISPLMTAVANNDIQGVQFYSKVLRSEINKQNIAKASALHIAARNGNFEIANILVQNGANVNLVDNEGYTALMRACLASNENITFILLQKKANVFLLNNDSESAIIHAASSGCAKCLDLILKDKSLENLMDIELIDNQLAQAFLIASKKNDTNIQDLLQKYIEPKKKIAVDKVPPTEILQDYPQEEKVVQQSKTFVFKESDISKKPSKNSTSKMLISKANKTKASRPIYNFKTDQLKKNYQPEKEIIYILKPEEQGLNNDDSQKKPIIYKLQTGPK